MSHKIFCVFICLVLLLGACGQKDLIEEMKKEVPLYQGAKIVKTSNPDEKTSVIQYEVAASEASEEDKIIDFYKDSMTKKGWEFQENELKRWKNNGSVFSLTKQNVGTLSVQTIIRGVEKTKKMTVVLNLTRG